MPQVCCLLRLPLELQFLIFESLAAIDLYYAAHIPSIYRIIGQNSQLQAKLFLEPTYQADYCNASLIGTTPRPVFKENEVLFLPNRQDIHSTNQRNGLILRCRTPLSKMKKAAIDICTLPTPIYGLRDSPDPAAILLPRMFLTQPPAQRCILFLCWLPEQFIEDMQHLIFSFSIYRLTIERVDGIRCSDLLRAISTGPLPPISKYLYVFIEWPTYSPHIRPNVFLGEIQLPSLATILGI